MSWAKEKHSSTRHSTPLSCEEREKLRDIAKKEQKTGACYSAYCVKKKYKDYEFKHNEVMKVKVDPKTKNEILASLNSGLMIGKDKDLKKELEGDYIKIYHPGGVISWFIWAYPGYCLSFLFLSAFIGLWAMPKPKEY
jgi:hypothetical protein